MIALADEVRWTGNLKGRSSKESTMSLIHVCHIGVCIPVLAVSLLAAQPVEPAPSPTPTQSTPAPAEEAPAIALEKPVTVATTHVRFPETPAKKLFATNDVRGRKAPDLKVEEWLTTEPNRKDKVVLIEFWATWAPPCRKRMTQLNELQKTFKGDLVVVGLTSESGSKVGGFLERNAMHYSVAIDTTEAISKALEMQAIPYAIVISSDGIVRWQGMPHSEEDTLTEAKLRQIIDADKEVRAKKAPIEAKPKPAESAAGESELPKTKE